MQSNFRGKTDRVSFSKEGYREQASYGIYNLVDGGAKRWLKVGSVRNNTAYLKTIIWPGGTVSGPVDGKRRHRIVTNIVSPFVRETSLVNNKCIVAAPCLSVYTKNPDTIDDIFLDFRKNVKNESRPYELKCCEGLSIDLLQRLAADLDFDFELYIVADSAYGIYNAQNNTWTGMVQDLISGAAHIGVGAFSITPERMRFMDFTGAYYYSGFSLLILEPKLNTPMDAFLEPFSTGVWCLIFFGAFVTAFAIALLEWNSPFGLNPWGRNRKTSYTLASGLNTVYAILFQHTIKTKSPKSWPCKWIQNFWAAASIVIFASYTANLAAFIAGKATVQYVSGIDDRKVGPYVLHGLLITTNP